MERGRLVLVTNGSQSPENGSRHCKGSLVSTPRTTGGPDGRNPLKTGLVTARRMSWWRLFGPPGPSRRNPLKTGLVTARGLRCPNGLRRMFSWSQSPENGSRHCKEASLPGWVRVILEKVAIP